MKFLLEILIMAAAIFVEVSEQAKQRGNNRISALKYHEEFGIPEAGRIRKAEEEMEKLTKLSAFNYHRRMKNDTTNNFVGKEVGLKIAGGRTATLGNFPYQAGLDITLTDGSPSVCGASLISSTRLVTAAHCWFNIKHQALHFTVVLGSVYLYRGGTRITTRDVRMHESWNPYNLANDIAIITIRHVIFNDYIQPIALPVGFEKINFVGALAVASGFGRTGDLAVHEITEYQTLNYLQLKVIPNKDCYFAEAKRTNICVSGRGGKSICPGDSGGPLAVNVKGQMILVGITSFAHMEGCTLGYPAAFTRVTSFLPWIQKYI